MVKETLVEKGPTNTVTAATEQVYVVKGCRYPMYMDGLEETEVRFLAVSELLPSMKLMR